MEISSIKQGKISHEKTWTWLKKGNLKGRNYFLQIAGQKNTVKIMLMQK